ncbi:MAG TPA: formate dehydrogenase subunit delta [Burkholderiales bacterium]|nr:formate dehydrogenase subunit delta [Burkholderiales bacterium]
MNTLYLVKMVNQIESFFRAEQDRDVAIAGIAGHLKRFWEPRMRTAIIKHLDAGGEGLGELAKSAVLKLAESSKTHQGS